MGHGISKALDEGMSLPGGKESLGTVDTLMDFEYGTPEGDMPEANPTANGLGGDSDSLAELATGGALKRCEVESHYKNLEERSPFSTTGAAKPCRFKRDDDPYSRTGIPWVYRPPNRVYGTHITGPESGARAVPTESSASIDEMYNLGKSGMRTDFKW